MRYEATMRLEPLGLIDLLAYESRGLVAPELAGWSRNDPTRALASLMPTSWRGFHGAYARSHGYFWIPCPRCGMEFGGHEVSTAAIPTLDDPNLFATCCTVCSIELCPRALSTGSEA